MKYILLLVIVGLPLFSYSNNNSDTLSLENKVERIYEYLNDYNEANDRNCRSEDNLYVIDPELFDFDWDAGSEGWVTTFANKTSLPIVQSLNKRIQEFNDSRKGIDANTGKPKDGLTMYLVFCPRFLEAYIKDKNIDLPDVHAVDNKADLERYFTAENAIKILEIKAEFDRLVNRVRTSMIKKHPLSMLYAYGSMTYVMPETKAEKDYLLSRFSIDYVPNSKLTDDEKEVMARVYSLESKINRKANLTSINKCSLHGDCVRQGIESIIASVKYNVDGDGKSMSKDSDCKPTKTWPLNTKDKETLLDAFENAGESLGDPAYSGVLADNATIFNNADPNMLPDKVYITQKLPDLVNLMQGEYVVKTIFVNAEAYIPDADRPKFAQDVFKKFGSPAGTIFVVVPYYYCTVTTKYEGGETDEKVSSLTLMPSVASDNEDLNSKMNGAFRNQLSFKKAFNLAFSYIKKDHVSYVGAYLWNGQLMFSSKIDKNVEGFSNLVDIYVMIDERVDQIQPYLNCKDESTSLNRYGHDGTAKTNVVPQSVYQDCLIKNTEEVRKIIQSKPNPTFREIKVPKGFAPGDFNMRQGELLGENGVDYALSFVKASVYKAEIKFSLGGNAGTISSEDTALKDNLFYGNQNPVRAPHWLKVPIEVGSFIAGFFGPAGFVFDATTAYILYAIGEDELAGEAAMSAILGIVVPAAFEDIAKNYKIAKKIEREGITRAVSEGGFFVRAEGKLVEATIENKTLNVQGAAGKDGVLMAAGVSKETVASVNQVVKDKVSKDLIDINKMAVRDGAVIQGSGPYALRNDANDRELLRRFSDALEKRPGLTFIEFRNELKNSRGLFNFSEKVNAALIKADDGFSNIVIDGVSNGKVVVNGREMTAKELAVYMKQNQYAGKPIAVISTAENNLDELNAFTDDLARELDTKGITHNTDIRITETGDVVSAVEGADVKWLRGIDYPAIPDVREIKGLFRPLSHVADERANRIFTFVPDVILEDGSVVCRLNGRITVLTPKQIADEMVAAGLRGDDAIFIGLLKNGNVDRNFDHSYALALELERETGSSIAYASKKTTFINRVNFSFEDASAMELPGTFNIAQDVDFVGQRKLTLFSEKNLKVNDLDGNIYVTINGFTAEGKVKVYLPHLDKVDEFTADQFYKEIQQVERNVLNPQKLAGKNIRIVPTDGAPIDETKVRGFLEDLSQKSKVKIETPKAPIDVADGSTIPVGSIDWMRHSSMPDGLYFLSKKLDRKIFNDLTSKIEDDAFLDALGLALSENNGKYLDEFLKTANYEKWIKDLSANYSNYGKVSIPTYLNVTSITSKLGEVPDALIKDLYTNALYAKTLDTQLKYLDAKAIQKLKGDADLFNEAVQFIESETMKNGPGLPTFMAKKNLAEKLSDEVAESLYSQYGNSELFFAFLNNEVDKLSAEALEKFKLWEKNIPDFLKDFKAKYPNTSLDLPIYMARVQEKSQINLVGTAFSDAKGAADKLLPQEGYFDVVLKTDGKNFIMDGEVLTPAEVAKRIRANSNWEEKPIRFIIDGGENDIKSPAQKVLDELGVQGKINPKKQFEVKEGKLSAQWEAISPSSAPLTPNNKLAFMAGTEQELKNVINQLPADKNSFTIVVEADADGFIQTQADGSKKLIRAVEMNDIIRANPNYTSGTPVKIIVKGEKGSEKTVQELINHLDVEAQVYDGALRVEAGKLVDEWKSVKAVFPEVILIDNTDEALKQLSSVAIRDPKYIDVYIHGSPNNFIVFFDGVKRTMTSDELAGRLMKDPTILKAIREGRAIRLISCSAGAGEAAIGLSAKIPLLRMIAANKILSVDMTGVLVSIERGAFWQEMKGGQILSRGADIALMVDVVAKAEQLVIRGEKNVVEIWAPRYRIPVGTGTLTTDGVLHMQVNVGIGMEDAAVAVTEDVEKAIKDEVVKRYGQGSIKRVEIVNP